MHYSPLMGESDDLGELPDQVQPLVQPESLVPFGQEMIQPHHQGIMLEDQSRTEFVLRVSLAAKNARMLQRLQQLGLAMSRTFDGVAFVLTGSRSDVVDADATANALQSCMCRLPVLVTGTFVDQVVEHIVADLAAALGGPNPRLIHRLRDDATGRLVVSVREVLPQAGTFATSNQPHNTRAVLGVPQYDVVGCGVHQIALQVRCRAEDNRIDPGNTAVLLRCLLPAQQRPQLLRFRVGQKQRVVDRGRWLAVGLPSPGPRIAAQASRSALDLDQEEALRRKNQQVDFVDAAIVADELEVGPCPVRLVRGKLRADKFKSFPFPRKT